MAETCSVRVYSQGSMIGHKCARAAKVDRDGVWYCRQHDPVAIEEKRAKKHAEWEKQWADKRAAQEEVERQKRLAVAAIAAIKAIAAGHNDPRGLAVKVLAQELSNDQEHGGV